MVLCCHSLARRLSGENLGFLLGSVFQPTLEYEVWLSSLAVKVAQCICLLHVPCSESSSFLLKLNNPTFLSQRNQLQTSVELAHGVVSWSSTAKAILSIIDIWSQ